MPELLSAARGEVPSGDDPLTGVAHLDQTWGQSAKDPLPTIAVSKGPYRYVRVTESGQVFERLYDARLDPAELVNQSTAEPEKLSELREVGDTYLEQQPVWGEAETRELSEMELNQLRALGYALP